jgi:hypothetical protein
MTDGKFTKINQKEYVMSGRYRVDCRKYPSEKGCTIAISGSLDEVVELGWLHAKLHHDHKDEEEIGLKEWIRSKAERATG